MCQMGLLWYTTVAALALGCARAQNGTAPADTCGALEPWDSGPWGSLLEEWAVSAPNHTDRHGRIMALPPAQGYYVTDRVDRPPPPPHHGPPPHGPPPHGPPPHGPPPGPRPYDEWQPPPPPPPAGPGKIVNRPPSPYKDKFKPSYQQQQLQQQPGSAGGPPRGPGPAADRLDAPPAAPQKQVSETDLYLLSAIEKLVWRVDLMEKRLRKMEESMHFLVAGSEPKPEPCVANFSRVGEACYHLSAEPADWKSASLQCRKLHAHLLELDADGERRRVLAAMLADKRIRGVDVWTGGLNPGLLWIWSHSARPVAGNATTDASAGGDSTAVTIVGDGRCLALVHDPALNTYVYRGQDCALRHRFVCEKHDDKAKLSNEIERVARLLRPGGARAGRAPQEDPTTS